MTGKTGSGKDALLEEKPGEKIGKAHKVMTGGFYGYTTAGWCGNCGRRRGPDGRCANCDPWWTSPIFQIGGPIVLLISLVLIVGIAVLKPGEDNRPRIPATTVTSTIPATRIPGYGVGGGYAATRIPASPPVIAAPRLSAYALPPSPDQIQYQRLQELRRMTAYVDSVVQEQYNIRAQQARYQSSYPVPAARRPASGRAQMETGVQSSVTPF